MSVELAESVLVIAAHPDDEVLGCGGTIARLAAKGAAVHVSFLTDGVASRQREDNLPDTHELAVRRESATRASDILGALPPSFDDLPDNQLDIVPLLRITQKVEALIDQYRPDTVFSHHAGDVNIDHRRVHDAVVTACRPQPGHPVRRLMFFEVVSSTEWQPPGDKPIFIPSIFVDISQTLEQKLIALRSYQPEMRPWPHARSIEAVEHLARWRGASAGMEAAEVFMIGRELV